MTFRKILLVSSFLLCPYAAYANCTPPTVGNPPGSPPTSMGCYNDLPGHAPQTTDLFWVWRPSLFPASLGTLTWAELQAASLAAAADGTVMSNITGGSAVPAANSLSVVLDHDVSSTQGALLYRNATTWVALPPGTAGQVLKTGGAANNLSWGSAPGGSGVTQVAFNCGITSSPSPVISIGTASLVSIANNSVLSNISGSTGCPSGNTLSAVIDSAMGNVQGDILYRNATGWVVLAPGTSGQVLVTGGPGSNPNWLTGGGGVTAVTAGIGLTATPNNPITNTGTLSLSAISDRLIMANISGGVAPPAGNTLSSILDYALSSTPSAIPYRGAGGWTVLAPITVPNVPLVSGGTGAFPNYQFEVHSPNYVWDSNSVVTAATITIKGHFPYANNSTLLYVDTQSFAGTFIFGVTDNGAAVAGCGTITSSGIESTTTCTIGNTIAQGDNLSIVIASATSANAGAFVQLTYTAPVK